MASSKPRSVDLGPMYLQVGQEESHHGSQPAGADAGDVARFQSLLGERRGRRSTDLPDDALQVPGPLEAPPAVAIEDGEKDLCDEIAHLWVGTGLHSRREVRMALRESLLPDTSVHLFEAGSCLRIEFICGTLRIADWLVRRLPGLARNLGGQLDRELELSVVHGDGSIAGSLRWAGGA